MVLYPNKLPESERVCSGICKRDNGSKMRGTIVQTETFFKSEIK